MDKLTIDDVFRSVILATLKSSDNLILVTTYFKILDVRKSEVLVDNKDLTLSDLSEVLVDDKDITFAHIQTICSRQFRRRNDQTAQPPRADTPHTTSHTLSAKPQKYNTYYVQASGRLGTRQPLLQHLGATWYSASESSPQVLVTTDWN